VIFHTPEEVGLFLGTSIHDTSQVAGAGLTYAQQFNAKRAMDTAVIVKLVRNVCMSVLIPLMALLYHRSGGGDARKRRVQNWRDVVPLFIIGFVLMACVRSLGDMGDGRAFGAVDRGAWERFCKTIADLAPWLLATAMAAVGLGTGFAKLKGLGWKPMSVAFAAALLVGGMSVLLIKMLAPFIVH
jgi:uncharacterized membrane protein YadS